MNTELFNRALGLVEPWTVSGYEINEDKEKITFFVEPEENSLLTCPHCEKSYVARNDYKLFDFDYLNFLQYKCYLEVKVPLLQCTEHGETPACFLIKPNKHSVLYPFPECTYLSNK